MYHIWSPHFYNRQSHMVNTWFMGEGGGGDSKKIRCYVVSVVGHRWDKKSKLCPIYVQHLSNVCPSTMSVQEKYNICSANQEKYKVCQISVYTLIATWS